MSPYTSTSLKAFILKELEKTTQPRVEPQSFTIGVEHEFFLLDENSQPVDHATSQRFFSGLAKVAGWKVRETLTTELGEIVWRVSTQDGGPRFTAFKYDHHPHLCEVAFSYFPNIELLHERVAQVFDELARVGAGTGVRVAHQPFIDIPTDDDRVVSSLDVFRNLRHYRSKLFKFRNQNIDKRLINYAAAIAATQTHIGGTNWWLDSNYVESLYSFEPEILPFGFLLSQTPSEEAIARRWLGYREVFFGYPLVGFPDMPKWTVDAWLEALVRSPLYGSCDDDWAGKSIADLKRNPFSSVGDFIKSVRDLQIIRPRLFGTLEFRSDPSQPNARALAAIAALRLGICIANLSERPRLSFIEAREAWWSIVTGVPKAPEATILGIAKSGLKLRGFDEEKFLLPLENAIEERYSALGKKRIG